MPDKGCTVWFAEGAYGGEHTVTRRFSTNTTFKSIAPYKAVFENQGRTVHFSGGKNITMEGFEFRHLPGATGIVVEVEQGSSGFPEYITFRNNIFHDSYDNDILKIRDGSRFVLVEGNILYNQGPGEQHMDVNGVSDVTIRGNIFFHDYAGSGRTPPSVKHYMVIKDSSGSASHGFDGSQRVFVQQNIFLNWQGSSAEALIQVGNDGKAYHEAKDVRIENNLFLGNSYYAAYALLGVKGARDVVFANNTVTGNLPAKSYALWTTIAGSNPPNDNIYLRNNIWSDATGTMSKFSAGDRSTTTNLVLDNNLYWNGGQAIPSGDVVSPLADDARRVVADPRLNTDHSSVVLPRWNGSTFLGGNASISQEYQRLFGLYGTLPADSPAKSYGASASAPAPTPTTTVGSQPTATATPARTGTPTAAPATPTPTSAPSSPTPTVTSPSAGRVLTVAQSGAQYTSIQMAINAAAAGDTVLVYPGVYAGSVTLNKAVNLLAAQYDMANPTNNTAVIDGSGAAAVISIPSGVSPQPSIVGFVIRNGDDGIAPYSPFKAEYNYFTAADDLIDYEKGGGGILRYNVFDGAGDDAVDLDNTVVDLLIEGNKILNSRQDGIEIRLQDDTIATQVTVVIRGNEIRGSGGDGIQFIDYYQDTKRIYKIERNLFVSNKQAAIGLMDNEVTSEDYRAASIREPIDVANNVFAGNYAGISGGDNLVAVNNIFVNQATFALKNVDGLSKLSHNLFWNNGVNFSGASNVDLATTKFADPLLGADYRLATGSPAIDAGVARLDHNGRTVINLGSAEYVGVAPDMGKYEWRWTAYLSELAKMRG